MNKWQVGCSWFLVMASCLPTNGQDVLQRDVLTTPPPGGVIVDGRGMVRVDRRAIPSRLRRSNKLVAVSLGKIDLVVRRRGLKRTDQLPLAMQRMGPLACVEHVYIVQDELKRIADIVLLGRLAEANQPSAMSLSLDDFLDAWRTRDNQSTCSIEPTSSGERRLSDLLKLSPEYNEGLVRRMAAALGDQSVKFVGIRDTSRFARIMLGADIRLKQLAMGLLPSRVRGLPSFPQLQRKAIAPQQPRWWITSQNPTLVCNEQKTFWTIPELTLAVSSSTAGQQADADVQRWADVMTKHYERAEAKHAPLAVLRSLFHWKLLAALLGHIEQDLSFQVEKRFSGLMRLRCGKHEEPKLISTVVTTARIRGRRVVTASGGVVIPKWDLNRARLGYSSELPTGLYHSLSWTWPIKRLPNRIEAKQSCSIYQPPARSLSNYPSRRDSSGERCCVCILVDVSKSMSTRRNTILRATAQQLNELEPGTPVIVAAFDSNVRFGFRGRVCRSRDWLLRPLGFITKQSFERDTDFVNALFKAGKFAPTSIVLISDGIPNLHTARSMLNYVRRHRLIPISTVCLSTRQDARVNMGAISLMTQGRITAFNAEF